MARTTKYPKKTSPEAPCDCSWCNPAKATSEYRKKRDKRDFMEALK